LVNRISDATDEVNVDEPQRRNTYDNDADCQEVFEERSIRELRQPVLNERVQTTENDQEGQLRRDPNDVATASADTCLLGGSGLLQGVLDISILLHFLDFSF